MTDQQLISAPPLRTNYVIRQSLCCCVVCLLCLPWTIPFLLHPQSLCLTCHSIKGMNAPVTGHVADWDARRAERGDEGLLKSTVVGYRGMPARGLCPDCSEEDFKALIAFMSSPPPGSVQP